MTEMEEKYGTLIQAFKMTWDSFPGAARLTDRQKLKEILEAGTYAPTVLVILGYGLPEGMKGVAILFPTQGHFESYC